MRWLYIEPDLTLRDNLKLRFWLLGMDLFAPFYAGRWRPGWGRMAYLHCVSEAGRITYGSDPGDPGPPEAPMYGCKTWWESAIVDTAGRLAEAYYGDLGIGIQFRGLSAASACGRRETMKPNVSRAKAQAYFERRLLDAEKAGIPCNLRGISGAGGCTHDRRWCWIDSWSLLFKALQYARRRGLVSIHDPWVDRSWLKAEER